MTVRTKQSKDNTDAVSRYYAMADTKLGYEVFLRGTRHYGLYRTGDSAWNWSAALRRMEDKLADELALPGGAYVLDAGCGAGDVALHLAATKSHKMIGIDILESSIAEARRRATRRDLSDQASFRVLSYAELDFPEGTFDGAYTMETLIHATDASVVLSQLRRVLKPGAPLVLIEYAHEAERNIPQRAVAKFRAVNDIAAMPSSALFEYGVLEHLLEEAGFRSITIEDITAQMLPMAWCFAVLSWLPYQIARIFGRADKVINAKGSVEFWRYRRYFRYNVYTARK